MSKPSKSLLSRIPSSTSPHTHHELINMDFLNLVPNPKEIKKWMRRFCDGRIEERYDVVEEIGMET